MKKNSSPDQPTTSELEAATAVASELETKLAELDSQLLAAQEREKRVLADYQNLVRRSQEERLRMAKLAASEMAMAVLQPLDHLQLAAEQIQDKGLSMVVTEFWQSLRDQGLEEIMVMGKPFDVTTMEVVEKKGTGEKVVAVASRGYRLNGEVIRHAKVILG